MPFAKRSGLPSQIDEKLKTKRQQIIEEERIRVLRESLMLFYDKLMEKYELIHLRDDKNVEDTESETKTDESKVKEVKVVEREEVEAFAGEYADMKPIGF